MLAFGLMCVLQFLSFDKEGCVSLTLKELACVQRQRVADFKAARLAFPHIVMGNVSADLDSVVSAMAASWTRGALPLINIFSSELSLRRDVVYLFDKFHIEASSFLFKEDFPLDPKSWKVPKFTLTLVDHNDLVSEEKVLIPYVAGIIDHHADADIDYPNLEEKNIEPVGSTATLLVEELSQETLDEEAAALLAAPILIDTDFLADPLKTTPRDVLAIERLKESMDWDAVQLLAYTLNEKKQEIPEGVHDLLKKDMKRYQEGSILYAISSLPELAGWNINNRNVWRGDVVRFQKSLSVPLWMGLIPSGKGKMLIVYAATPKMLNAIMIHFSADETLRDLLRFQIAFSEEGLLFYKIDNPIPRKTFQPLLKLGRSPFVQSVVD